MDDDQRSPAESLLAGLRVLDLADLSGALCGRTLADLGADVVRVEPPAGDRDRLTPPFAGDQPGPDRSLPWLAANANKRSLTCDLGTTAGVGLFRRLADVADVVIESFTPGRMDEMGLGYESLAERNPALIYTTVTPFGSDGPFATAPAGDLEITAASGSLWLAGDVEGPPVRNSQPQAAAWAGMYAAMGTLLAVLARDASPFGRGQRVDTSAQASMITAISHAPIFWDLLGEEQTRTGPFLGGRSVTGALFRNIWPCKDGYVTFALYGGAAGRHTSLELVAWMDERMPGGAPDILKRWDWETFDTTLATPQTVAELEAAIAPFILTVTKDEMLARFAERNMLGYKVSSTEDILRDEQLEARGFWQQVPASWDPSASITFPGSFALFDGQRPRIRRTAPRAGEHTAQVLEEWLGQSARATAYLAGRGAG